MVISGVILGNIKPYSTPNGYIYIHIPQYVCKQFNITPAKLFTIICVDDKIVLKEE